MEGDFVSCRVYQVGIIFQSTPSVWRETNTIMNEFVKELFQSTPSVWRETGCTKLRKNKRWTFQSTPSVWRETLAVVAVPEDSSFQSTPSVWRETATGDAQHIYRSISIHSLRMEGDFRQRFHPAFVFAFQSTPSVWRETGRGVGENCWL